MMFFNALSFIGKKMLAVVILAVMVALAMLLIATGPTAEPGERVERVWPVSSTIVYPDNVSPVMLAYGRLESAQVSQLRTRINATVLQVLHNEGDWVEAGALLVQLDPLDAELAVAAARSARAQAQAALGSVMSESRLADELSNHHETQHAIAQARLARFEQLHGRRMISDADLDDMRQQASEQAMVLARHLATIEDFPNQLALRRAALAEADARLRLAEQDLLHTALRAPFSGRVLLSDVAEGERVAAGSSLMQLADYDRLQLRVSLPVAVAAELHSAVQAGSAVAASASLGGREVNFVLRRLAADVKPGQSGVDTFFVTDSSAELLIGSLASLHIALPPQADVVVVPVHALYEGDLVYLIEENRLQAVAVERVGDYVDDAGIYRILVRSPRIQAGKRLMTTQLPIAMTGLRVDPVGQDDMPVMLSSR